MYIGAYPAQALGNEGGVMGVPPGQYGFDTPVKGGGGPGFNDCPVADFNFHTQMPLNP